MMRLGHCMEKTALAGFEELSFFGCQRRGAFRTPSAVSPSDTATNAHLSDPPKPERTKINHPRRVVYSGLFPVFVI